MMIEWMIGLLNMTFTAGCTVLLILILRLLFRKLPKGYSYALWFIVLFRFLCPVAIPSPLSLLPVSPEPMKQEIVYEKTPEIDSGVIWVDRAVNQVFQDNLSAEGQETNPAVQKTIEETGNEIASVIGGFLSCYGNAFGRGMAGYRCK